MQSRQDLLRNHLETGLREHREGRFDSALEAFRQAIVLAPDNADALNLLDPKTPGELLADIGIELPEAYQRPALIIVDTLARCMVGGDENSAKDMGLFIAHADALRKETGATVLIIHHTGKNGRASAAAAPCAPPATL